MTDTPPSASQESGHATDGADQSPRWKPDPPAGWAMEDELRRLIQSGRIGAGERLASIRQLSEKYDLSFAVTHAVINRLKQDGLVVTEPGRAIFVGGNQKVGDLNSASTREADGGDSQIASLVQADAAVDVATQPTTAPRTSRMTSTRTVAVLGRIRGHLFSRLATRLQKQLDANGFESLSVDWPIGHSKLAHLPDSVEAALNVHAFSAYVLIGTPVEMDQKLACVFPEQATAFTVFRDSSEFLRSIHIGPAWLQVYRMMAQRLEERGHRHVALITYGRSRLVHGQLVRKRDAHHMPAIRMLSESLGRCQPKIDLSLCYTSNRSEDDYDMLGEKSLDALSRCLASRRHQPTALVGDDFHCVAGVRAAQRLGWTLGKDFEVIGIGRTPWSQAFGFESISLEEDVAADLVVSLLRMRAELPTGSVNSVHQIIPKHMKLNEGRFG